MVKGETGTMSLDVRSSVDKGVSTVILDDRFLSFFVGFCSISSH